MGLYDRGYVRNPYSTDDRHDGDSSLRLGLSNTAMVTIIIVVTSVIYLADFLTRSRAILPVLELTSNTWTQPLVWFRYLTYGFVHSPSSIFHLIFNMMGLFFLGPQVEQRLGKYEFLRFYLISILVGGIVWGAIHTGRNSSVVGASGGVQAVVMLFVLQNPQATLMLYFAIPVKAWVLGVLMLVSNLFSTRDGTAVEVHLAGIAFSAAYFYIPFNLHWLSWDRWFSLQSRQSRATERRRAKLRVHAPPESTATDDEIDADRILDKIHREGEASLTASERTILERYSRKMRDRRGST